MEEDEYTRLLRDVRDNISKIADLERVHAVMEQSIKDHVLACEKQARIVNARINWVMTISVIVLAAVVGQYFTK